MFVSYAQNCEDVLLFRALGQVEKGCYVDVGAADPVADSVTCAFYQRGWRGINIEPSPMAFERLAKARPEDVNLNIAVGNTNGSLPFYLIGGGNVLSTASPQQLDILKGQGWSSSEIRVPVRTLASVIQDHPRETVHFLKVDVEGGERDVLAGAELDRFRPWIVLVEATAPNSQVPTHGAWEEILLAAQYRFAWFDGLNRFYAAAERSELLAAFTIQPNVFDKYVKYAEALAAAQLRETSQALAAANANVVQLKQQIAQLQVELAAVRKA